MRGWLPLSILSVKFNFLISILTVLRSTISILTVNIDFPILILVELLSSDSRNEDPLLLWLERTGRCDIRSYREHIRSSKGQVAQNRDGVLQLRLPLDQRRGLRRPALKRQESLGSFYSTTLPLLSR